jgi:hypothetical protein
MMSRRRCGIVVLTISSKTFAADFRRRSQIKNE